jgi:hypothetical protein
MLVACAVKSYMPVVVGVPDTTPAAESAMPGGRVPVATENV